MSIRLTLFLSLVGLAARADNLLAHRAPIQAPGVAQPGRLTDGQDNADGDAWDGPNAVLLPADAFIEWDLGAAMALSGAALQGDNNDIYIVSVSDDGISWREAWRAAPEGGPGLRTRSVLGVLGQGRYIRLSATGGDGRFSVSEFELFHQSDAGSVLLRSKWMPHRPLEHSFVYWIFTCGVLLALSSRKLPAGALMLLGAIGLATTAYLVFEATPHTPDAAASLPWIRASVALVALAAVVREHLWAQRWPSHSKFVLATLGVTAALSVWCFLNLGTPQFRDVGANRATWLHHYDMRTYYPIAKYFPELRFDGVYAASVLAVAEGRDLGAFDAQPLRDLRTHEITTVGKARAHLAEVRARFSPERWALFLQDMAYFRRAMGDGGFLGSMNDHGGNATPVWFLAARALFAFADASDATLWSGVIADIVLFALAIVALAWAFGLRTALVATTLFGAIDFYQFGSNWFGATLRHDWLSLWAIGLALLHRNKLVWAGAVLAWSAWIRAFPALTLLTLSLPALWQYVTLQKQHRPAEAKAALKPLFQVVVGVALSSAALLFLSTSVFGLDAWTEWLRKVQLLDKDNHLNNIAFRTYISDDKTLWKLAVASSLAGLTFVLRGASLARAAVFGVVLLPIVFNPANYYLHSVFLLATLGSESLGPKLAWGFPRDAWNWTMLLLMCVGSYFTSLTSNVALHFQQETQLLFAALVAVCVLEWWPPSDSSTSTRLGMKGST